MRKIIKNENVILNKYNTNNNKKINEWYKKTIINIDSWFRTKIPKNITDNIQVYDENSLFFYAYDEYSNTFWGSYYMYVYKENHGLQKNDKIIIESVNSKTYIWKNDILEFWYNDEYVKVYHTQHNLIDQKVLDYVN